MRLRLCLPRQRLLFLRLSGSSQRHPSRFARLKALGHMSVHRLDKIAATVQGHELRAVVENTGRWVDPATPAPRGTQIGLTNLKRRLELYYQGRAKFHQESLPEAVRITLTLPLTSTR